MIFYENHFNKRLIVSNFPLYGAYRVGKSSQFPFFTTALRCEKIAKLNFP